MTNSQRRSGRAVVVVLGLLASTLFTRSWAQQAAMQSPASKLVTLKLKFDGARSCGGNNCHDKAGDDAPPAEPGHEFTIWNNQDSHHKSFDGLSNATSKKIAGALKIADATTDAKCVTCHALSVPTELRGEKFNIRDGNTCGQCHGPSEKWLKPHSEKGWLDKQRASNNHDALLNALGLYDTKPLVARAEICVSCHLAIDHELVVAGHPQPMFDLDYFTALEPKHWKDPEGYFGTKVWLAGQMVAVKESMQQLATRATADKASEGTKAAYQQAMAHLTVFKSAAATLGLDVAGMDVKSDAMATDAANVAKLADGLKAKVDAWEPKESPLPMLKKIAAEKSLAKDYGLFGMKQMGYALSALYNSAAKGGKFKDTDKDAMNKMIDDKFFPEKGEIKADTFEKDLADIVAKLPQ
ncbi:MAG TPA: multiheme c-type cytochrome [Tepidisphaeraceae bacterium]|nr:multiheme c-type cytochrome [Tepidisphaeraceae bacterium]